MSGKAKPRSFDAPKSGTARERYPELFYDQCSCGARKDKRVSACRKCKAATRAALRATLADASRSQTNARARAWWSRTNSVRRERRREYYAANRTTLLEKQRESRLRGYGLTPESFDALVSLQANKCALCETPFESRREIHVDHDHSNDKVRGLLCIVCNHALGALGDDPVGIEKALRYTQRTR